MADEAKGASEDARIETGVVGLDLILGGGLIRGSIYMVMGRPGTGKTTLGNQLCFEHVARGGRAVYVTLLSESHASMLKNLREMAFFDASVINQTLAYVGAYKALRDRKLAGLLDLLRRVIRDERATMLVIDGVSSAHALAESDIALKEFIVELQMLCGMTNCTAVLLANMTADDATGPEHTMVDGLIELSFRRVQQYLVREIEVVKFRGSPHFLGANEFEIGSAGVTIRPRTEEILRRRERSAPSSGVRMPTGVAHLDAMLGGGLLSGTTTMVLGFSGSGKTMLGLHFLDTGAARDEPSLYFGFYESPERLLANADGIGLGLRAYAVAGRVGLLWQTPERYNLDALADRLLNEVQRRKVRRLVIDGLDGIRQASCYPERTIHYVTALLNELRALDVTTLIADETHKLFGPEIEIRVPGMSALVENLFLLEYLDVGTELKRLLSIVKQRSSGYDSTIRELYITDRGMTLAPDSRSAEHILAGSADLAQSRNRKPRPFKDTPTRGKRGRRG